MTSKRILRVARYKALGLTFSPEVFRLRHQPLEARMDGLTIRGWLLGDLAADEVAEEQGDGLMVSP